jgi:alanine-glyoxylate transaminase/serine-glyoxylate transaminase/serine-pyruvate transaminase
MYDMDKTEIRKEPPLLMIPGPTNLHSKVLEMLSQPQIAHTSDQFYKEFLEILDLTRYVFRTNQEVIVFSGSGTSGMESVSASVLEKGDRVLSVETGFFGRRFTKIAEIYGCKVEKVVIPEGDYAKPEILSDKLSAGNYDAVLLTHVETSTGVENPIPELASVAKKHNVLTIVDTVCGLGGIDFEFDKWGIDVAFSASQKCIAAPPGATLLALSEQAIMKMSKRKSEIPSYYYNLSKWLEVMKDPHIYLTTPSTSVLRALRVALQMIKEEGIENRWIRHKNLANAFRAGLLKSGISIFAKRPADTVTAIYSRDPEIVARKMYDQYNIMIARGLDTHKSDMLRIGHMGNVDKESLMATLSALVSSMMSNKETKMDSILEPLLQLK